MSLPLSYSHVFSLLWNQDAFWYGYVRGIGLHSIKLLKFEWLASSIKSIRNHTNNLMDYDRTSRK